MRRLILTLALLAAACVDVKPPAESSVPAEGYTLEVRAEPDVQVFLVTAPDGQTVAGRTAGGVSALMDAAAIQALAGAPSPADDELQEVVSLRLPGLNLSVSGDPDEMAADGGGGRVAINVGGHSVEVDANEGGPGDDDDRAHVRITGVSEEEAREFVTKADQLSPEVQAQMLSALGLE